MQSRDGGWGAFDVDNQAMWLYRIPFCDFGKVTDEPSADVTAHALEALAPEDGYDEAVDRGLDWLLAEQEDDGSWFGRWGVNHLYGTGAALPALEACGVPADHPAVRRAVAWLDSVQQERRRLRRGHPLVRGPRVARRAAPSDAVADRLGAARLRRPQETLRLRVRGEPPIISALSSAKTATGTRRTSPAPGFPLDFMIRYHLYRITLPAARTRPTPRKALRMKFPLRSRRSRSASTSPSQQRKGERYPLVLMLEPTLACNIACIGCGKIREYESNRARLTVEECIDAGVQCPAPVVSICGGEPLVYKGIEDVVAGMIEMGKTVELCTNALRLEQCLDLFEPSPRLTFVVHLDGMREIHDYVCDYPGLWDIAVDAIKNARARGFRVTTNTTIFKETEVDDVIEMMRYLTDEVGIDGMLVAPGYQYSQIDPALTMTRAEHEEKFRAIRAAVRKHGYRWIATPIYQDFLTGERKLSCAPWGSITRNPYGWKGPCYLLTDGIFPTYEALLDGMEWEAYGPGNDPRCEHCGDPLRLRAVGRVRVVEEPEGDRAEHGVDADGLTVRLRDDRGGAGREAARASSRRVSACAR